MVKDKETFSMDITIPHIVGKPVNNVKRNHYVDGGTFCSECRVGFDFTESLQIYRFNIEKGSTSGIPRCLSCGCSLRTRSKASYISGFWDRIKVLNGKANGEIKK